MKKNNNLSTDDQQVVLDTLSDATPDISLSEEQKKCLLQGLDELHALSAQNKDGEQRVALLNDFIENSYVNSESSSFKEDFPNYKSYVNSDSSSFKEDLSDYKPFVETQLILDHINTSQIVEKLFNKEGFIGFMRKFRENSQDVSSSAPLVTKFLNKDFLSNSLSEPHKEILDYTLRQVIQGLEPLSTLVRNNIDSLSVGVSGLGGILSVLLLYNGLCKGDAIIRNRYSPSALSLKDLSPAEKLARDKEWLLQSRRFRFIAAPILVFVLYGFKQITSPIKVNISVIQNTDIETGITKSILFVGLIKKLPGLIGKFLLIIILFGLINYLFNAYSIQLLDPFYIKIFCVIGLIVCFIVALDYFVKFIIITYFKKDVDVIIPNKLPKMVYNYLNHLKILSKIEISFQKVFLVNLFIYVFIIFLLILLLILI